MVYNGRSGGRYDSGGYGGGYQRRDSGARRSAGSTFGAIDLGGSSRQQSYNSGPSVSPWASGQGPNRHSWGGAGGGVPPLVGRGGQGDVFAPLGGGGGGGGQSDTLNMAASLVASLLQNQRQREPAPAPYGARPDPFGPPSSGYGGGYRGARSSSFGRSEFGHRAEYNKFDRRDGFTSPGRGRATYRGRGASTRSRPYTRGATSAGRTPGKQVDKSAPKKKPETKKGVKTTQEAIDEAKAAALEKAAEGADGENKGAEGAELISKEDGEGAKEGEKASEDDKAKEGEKTAEAGKEAETKEAEKKPAKPTKPVREKIQPEYLVCTVCNINSKSESSFNEHTRGRKHQLMMELMEQKLEQKAKLIRIEIQLAWKRNELEMQRKNPKMPKEQGYCGMCNVRVYMEINEHRTTDPLHAKLKKFLHPRCCGMGFDTPVLYERHLLSFTHFRKTQQRDKDRAAAGTDIVPVEGEVPPPAKENGDTAPAEGEAKEGEAKEGEAKEGGTKEGEAAPAEGQEKAEPMQTDEQKKEEEEEEIPVSYDESVAVGKKLGQAFSGTYCTVCRLATPEEHWLEHCRSRMHYNRFMVARAAAERARKEAAEETEDQVTVVETEEEPAENGEKRGTKRPAEGGDEEATEAKKAATDEVKKEDVEESLDKVLDEINEELDGMEPKKEGEEAAETAEGEEAAPEEGAEKTEEAKEEEKPSEAAKETPAKPAAQKQGGTPRGGRGGRGFRGSPGRGFARRSRGRGGRR